MNEFIMHRYPAPPLLTPQADYELTGHVRNYASRAVALLTKKRMKSEFITARRMSLYVLLQARLQSLSIPAKRDLPILKIYEYLKGY